MLCDSPPPQRDQWIAALTHACGIEEAERLKAQREAEERARLEAEEAERRRREAEEAERRRLLLLQALSAEGEAALTRCSPLAFFALQQRVIRSPDSDTRAE